MADYDVLIIGAGAAGLAAAAELGRRGRAVCVLEARERIGGRILTAWEPGLPLPLELGAEFVHGRPGVTLEWLGRGAGVIVDAGGSHWMLHDGNLEPSDALFGELRRGFASAARPQTDLPLADFLAANGAGLSARACELARMLVEGFDAADAGRVSTLATLEEWQGQGAADAPTFRPLGGYEVLLEALRRALERHRVRLRLGAVVREIRWSRAAVMASGVARGRRFRVRAARAVVTLPLGVLQEGGVGAVRFVPALDAKRSALEGLAAGPVIKVLLRFRHAFWEAHDGERYRDAAFFHAPDAPVPTFWTALPVRAPLLTAWAAGPKAAALANASERSLVVSALSSLESLFGPRRGWRSPLESAHVYDWQADPFARGGYSYVVSGAAGSARAVLARPLEGTLFFAGEAADVSGESGTVAGALQSGRRAAAEVLRSARGRRRTPAG